MTMANKQEGDKPASSAPTMRDFLDTVAYDAEGEPLAEDYDPDEQDGEEPDLDALVDELLGIDTGAPPQEEEFRTEEPDLRGGPGRWERATDAYQRALVAEYDAWASETGRLALLPDRTLQQARVMLDARLTDLETNLLRIGRSHIGRASGLGLGSALRQHRDAPRVQAVANGLLAANDDYVRRTLIPSLRQQIGETLRGVQSLADPVARASYVEAALAAHRGRVAAGAGAAWVAIFEVQAAAGREENAERRADGQLPISVRWVLDPQADHCSDDPARATFGCPNLAREYPEGWDAMPTQPAGNVSCLGNCRCHVEADLGNGWERIT